LANIAAELDETVAKQAAHGTPGQITTRQLARGHDWMVYDVLCTFGPQDRPFEEKAPCVFITLVVAGSFYCRSAAGCSLLTPGSLMLGHANQCFERRLEPATGVRCLSFRYAPGYFERLAADTGARARRPAIGVLHLPPSRSLSPLVAQAYAGLTASLGVPWEELSVQVAAESVRVVETLPFNWGSVLPGAAARVATAVRFIERYLVTRLTLGDLAREAGLSRFHFLRTFQRLIGVTPHRYILRARLREAAMRLEAESTGILNIALDCGFSDLSNFSRAFRAEFGVSPRVYRGVTKDRLGEVRGN
jgi:AraC-like DNA-binding protein